MKTFNVDEGTFTLKPDSLLFKSNGRGLARGLPEQMTIPISEIVNVQELPSTDGAELVFTLAKDDFQFKVSYPKSSYAQAGEFLDALRKVRLEPGKPIDGKVSFSSKGREKTRSEKNALKFLYGIVAVILFLIIGSALSGPTTPAQDSTPIVAAVPENLVGESAPAPDVAAPEAEELSEVDARIAYAAIVEESARKNGSDASPTFDFSKTQASADGVEKETLIVENPDFNPEIARLFAQNLFSDNSRMLQGVRNFKFESVVITNGISSWTMDVEKGDWWNVGN